jgi:hypothetical protein
VVPITLNVPSSPSPTCVYAIKTIEGPSLFSIETLPSISTELPLSSSSVPVISYSFSPSNEHIQHTSCGKTCVTCPLWMLNTIAANLACQLPCARTTAVSAGLPSSSSQLSKETARERRLSSARSELSCPVQIGLRRKFSELKALRTSKLPTHSPWSWTEFPKQGLRGNRSACREARAAQHRWAARSPRR